MEFLRLHWFDLLTAVTYIVTAASIITKFTKTESDDHIVAKILNFLAMVPKK